MPPDRALLVRTDPLYLLTPDRHVSTSCGPDAAPVAEAAGRPGLLARHSCRDRRVRAKPDDRSMRPHLRRRSFRPACPFRRRGETRKAAMSTRGPAVLRESAGPQASLVPGPICPVSCATLFRGQRRGRGGRSRPVAPRLRGRNAMPGALARDLQAFHFRAGAASAAIAARRSRQSAAELSGWPLLSEGSLAGGGMSSARVPVRCDAACAL